METDCYVGIEIGGTKLQMAVGTATGQLLERHRFAVDRQQGAAGIRHQIQRALTELVQRWRPQAVGVGFGGPVDWRAGRVCVSHHVAGWANFELAAWLSELTGLPVQVDNDANVAALGEARCGAGANSDPVFYVTLGSGVGGGLISGGRIYHGAPPGEAELGHVRLDRAGTIVEARCSGWAVDAKIRALVASGSESLLARLARSSPGSEARHLGPALAAHDAAAWQILRETAQDLAFALSHATHLFHPQVIVLGGGLSLTGEPLRAAVAEALPGLLMEAFRPGPTVRLAALGEDAVPVGAILLAHQAVAR